MHFVGKNSDACDFGAATHIALFKIKAYNGVKLFPFYFIFVRIIFSSCVIKFWYPSLITLSNSNTITENPSRTSFINFNATCLMLGTLKNFFRFAIILPASTKTFDLDPNKEKVFDRFAFMQTVTERKNAVVVGNLLGQLASNETSECLYVIV